MPWPEDSEKLVVAIRQYRRRYWYPHGLSLLLLAGLFPPVNGQQGGSYTPHVAHRSRLKRQILRDETFQPNGGRFRLALDIVSDNKKKETRISHHPFLSGTKKPKGHTFVNLAISLFILQAIRNQIHQSRSVSVLARKCAREGFLASSWCKKMWSSVCTGLKSPSTTVIQHQQSYYSKHRAPHQLEVPPNGRPCDESEGTRRGR